MNLQDTDLTSEDYYKENNDSIIFLTSVFKDIWDKIDTETEEKLWQRLQILVKLCEKWKTE